MDFPPEEMGESAHVAPRSRSRRDNSIFRTPECKSDFGWMRKTEHVDRASRWLLELDHRKSRPSKANYPQAKKSPAYPHKHSGKPLFLRIAAGLCWESNPLKRRRASVGLSTHLIRGHELA